MSTGGLDAALAALPAAPAAVEITGDGELAAALRAALAGREWTDGAPPAAIVETTGEPGSIREALSRVADLGTVVLAGPPPTGAVALDLYADLHVRGLTLVGTLPDAGGRR
jgi:threonine dehydrogenase-like Zn-dependent dehydrogenase